MSARGTRPIRLAAALGVVLGAGLLGTGLLAHTSFETAGGLPLKWPGGGQGVSFVINDQGSDDVPDASDDLAIRLGFHQWSRVDGATVSFAENTSPSQQARTDWESTGIHLVLFDEDDSTGQFPDGSNTLALTFVSFNTGNGQIVDADILFNGNGFDWATDGSGGAIDIANVGTHEIGHFVGFNHSTVMGATMAPFSATGQLSQRSLSADDKAGARLLYPGAGDAGTGRLQGTVKRAAGGAGVSGANVWARAADGRIVAQDVTDGDGDYLLTGLDDGTFTVVAGPIDGAIQPGNLSLSGGFAETDFETASIQAVVSFGGTTNVNDLLVDTGSPPVKITGPGTPIIVRRGQTKPATLFGSGLGTTSASVPGGATEVAATGGGNAISVSASLGAALGSYDLELDKFSGTDTVTGLIEVVPQVPSIASIEPAVGVTGGGTTVTITGEGFGDEPVVVFGGVIVDPEVTDADGGEALVLTSPGLPAGDVDVTVVNDGGETVTEVDGFSYGLSPVIDSAFPTVVSQDGGAVVRINGSAFAESAAVTFGVGGEPATAVTWVDETRLDATVPALAPGGYHIVVTNEEGFEDSIPFGLTVVAESDPMPASVSPDVVTTEGGAVVTVTGSGFVDTPLAKVGVSPVDGSGGLAASVAFDGPTQLTLTLPALEPGSFGLLVTNPLGAQGLLAGAVTAAPTVGGKDKFLGEITSASDKDAVFIDALGGTELTVTVKRGKKSQLTAKVVVRAEDGSVLASSDEADPEFDPTVAKVTGKSVKLKRVPLPAEPLTSRIAIEITSLAGSVGGYTLSFKEKLPKELGKLVFSKKEPAPVTGATPLEIPLVAKPGSTLSGSIKSKDGVLPFVAAFADPERADLLAAPEVADTITVSKNLQSVKFKQTPLEVFGEYLLTIGTDAGNGGVDGTITGKLTIKPPKSKDKITEASE